MNSTKTLIKTWTQLNYLYFCHHKSLLHFYCRDFSSTLNFILFEINTKTLCSSELNSYNSPCRLSSLPNFWCLALIYIIQRVKYNKVDLL